MINPHITANQSLNLRDKARRRVTLGALVFADRGTTNLLVRNIWDTGMLLEGHIKLEIGEIVDVELPHVAICAATVMWRDGDYRGCEFKDAVPAAAISAALLRSLPDR